MKYKFKLGDKVCLKDHTQDEFTCFVIIGRQVTEQQILIDEKMTATKIEQYYDGNGWLLAEVLEKPDDSM